MMDAAGLTVLDTFSSHLPFSITSKGCLIPHPTLAPPPFYRTGLIMAEDVSRSFGDSKIPSTHLPAAFCSSNPNFRPGLYDCDADIGRVWVYCAV